MSPLNKTLVAISGVARSGKDAFCNILCNELNAQGIPSKRYALADELKRKIRQPLLELSGVDILNCTPKDKELVRDYLVAVGKIKRYQTEGTYWTSLLEQDIKSDRHIVVPVVTDIRYDVFPNDEIWWAQTKMNGVLVHLSRYEILSEDDMWDWDHHHNTGINQDPVTKEWRNWIQAPNEDEKNNNPKLKNKADYVLEWSTTKNPERLHEHCLPYVLKFISYLKENRLT